MGREDLKNGAASSQEKIVLTDVASVRLRLEPVVIGALMTVNQCRVPMTGSFLPPDVSLYHRLAPFWLTPKMAQGLRSKIHYNRQHIIDTEISEKHLSELPYLGYGPQLNILKYGLLGTSL